MAIMPDDADQREQPQASGGSSGIPPDVRRIRCKRCGCAALLARAHPDTIAQRGRRSKVLLLEPEPRPGRGAVTFTDSGLAKYTQLPGDWVTHMCQNRASPCMRCGDPVRILRQPPDAAEVLAVVGAAPDPDGVIVINNRGHAVPDPGFVLPGRRFSLHTHGGSGSGTESLMREIPRGAR